jgi:hypothetical protein
MGNIEQESSFTTTTTFNESNGGVAHGLCQWTYFPGGGGRWNSLLSWASARGLNYGDIEVNVEYMLKEMRENWGGFNDNEFRNIHSIDGAARYFGTRYEVYGSAGGRYEYAPQMYDKYKSVRGFDVASTTRATAAAAVDETDQRGPSVFNVIEGTVSIAVYYKETVRSLTTPATAYGMPHIATIIAAAEKSLP